jgi:hypothetical protein
MQATGSFGLVRSAFATNPLLSLKKMGVEVKSDSPKGDWLQVACPICPDKSGSASVSVKSGWLTCHQCGTKGDLFAWWSIKDQLSPTKPFDSCKALADLLGVVLPVRKGRKGTKTWPKEMTVELMEECTRSLLEDEENDGLRTFLRQRCGHFDQERIERLHLGAINGEIIFTQFWPDGRLRPRYRRYNPSGGDRKWSWSAAVSGSAGALGFWPFLGVIKPDQLIWLCEGEWDVLAALDALEFEQKGIMVVTWTGGAGSPIPPHAIPDAWRGHAVEICYDNDTFQGPGEDSIAPDEKKRTEMLRRRKNLIEGVGDSFAQNRCPVFLRAIPINPLEKWGADLRDWVNAGNKDLAMIPQFTLEASRRSVPKALQINYGEVFDKLHTDVKMRCQVGAVNTDVLLIPKTSILECDMGTKAICSQCKGPIVAPGGVLDWGGRQEQLAQAMIQRNPSEWIIENVVGKPRSCTPCRVKTQEGTTGAAWVAQAKEGDDEQRMIEVVSTEQPPLSGEMEITGRVYPTNKSAMVWCTNLVPLDKQLIDLSPLKFDLLNLVPYKAEHTDQIDDYLAVRHMDVSNHVTHVFGRQSIHTTLELAAHSALWIHHEGTKRRGWLDCAIIGATRSGKSVAARTYLAHLGLGQHFTMMGNFSRAGFTIGSASVAGQQKMKPGLLPRNHGKMLVLDEAHLMLSDDGKEVAIFPMLQAARDIGRVEGTKIYGSQSLPAAVRLVSICNWLNGGKRSFAHPCEHLLQLYGSPESLSRLDFAVGIDELEESVGPQNVENHWTVDLMRAVVIRAWNMEPDQITFAEGAVELARQVVGEEWTAKYSEELPLFTQKEKLLSVLRIAVAVANMTLSHVGNDLSTCSVRKVHVQWAIKWLEQTWEDLGYARFSASCLSSQSVLDPFGVEFAIGANLSLDDPVQARNVLNKLFGAVSKEELRSVVGMDYSAFERWLMTLMRKGVFEINRTGGRGFFVQLRLTKGGFKIVKGALLMAEDYPELWPARVQGVRTWFSMRNGPAVSTINQDGPNGMVPLDTPLHLLEHQWKREINEQAASAQDEVESG